MYETKVNGVTRPIIYAVFPWLLQLLPENVRRFRIVHGIDAETLGIGPDVRASGLSMKNDAIGRVLVLDGQGVLMISVGLHNVMEPAFWWHKERQVSEWRAENLEGALLRFPERALQMRYVVHLFDDEAVLYHVEEEVHDLGRWLREKKVEERHRLTSFLNHRL